MYAIVEVSGKQYKVEKDSVINVDKLGSSDARLTIDKVLLLSRDSEVMIGTPYLSNVKISAERLGDVKGKKVSGIKFKKRKRYTRNVGQRPVYTALRISDLTVN